MGLVRALAQTDGDVALTAEAAAATYRTVQAAKAVLLRIEAQLESWATVQPVPLGGGRFWGIKLSDQWRFEPGAPATLRQLLGPTADKALGVSLSSTSLAKAVGKDEARRLTAVLEQQGLATRKQVARLAEYQERGEG